MLKMRLLLLCLLLSLSSLLWAQGHIKVEPADTEFLSDYHHSYYSQEFGFNVPINYNTMLYDTIVSWLGTPYRFSGNCEKGIDCSGFVNVLYDRVLGIKLGARNSGEIYHLLEKIDTDDLKEGDLVFFSIRKRRISHIGLYLGNNKFVHSSSSKGVIISDLGEPYYKHHFAGAGRKQENPDATSLRPADE
jgi:murein DD-endopeptidase / murein LD-carboxypeptidase